MAQPGLKRLAFKKARASVLLTAVLCGLSLGLSGQAEGSDKSPTNVRISATVQDVSVGEALEIVGVLAGLPIEVTGAIGDRRISVNLQSVTLEKALDRILYRLNYVVVWSLDDRLSIRILDSEDFDEPFSLFPGDDEVWPPSQPGEPSITIADLKYYRSFWTDVDPAERGVLPPSSFGGVGLTQADIEFFSAMHQVPDPADMELFPPESENGVGLTLAEFEAMRLKWPALAPSQIELFPPESEDGVGLALAEFEAMKPSRPGLPPSQIEVLPPDLSGETGLTLEEPNQ